MGRTPRVLVPLDDMPQQLLQHFGDFKREHGRYPTRAMIPDHDRHGLHPGPWRAQGNGWWIWDPNLDMRDGQIV